MTPVRWQFTGMEFHVLWEAIGRDRLPYPLKFRPVADTTRDLRAQRTAAALRLHEVLDERVHRALAIIAEPSTRIEVCGLHGPDMRAVTRIHAGISGELAVLAEQFPGADPDNGADVVLTLTPVGSLPEEIVRRLPPCSAGRERSVSIRPLARTGGAAILTDVRAAPASEEIERFFGRPRTSVGEIAAYPGPAVDSRPTDDGVLFRWYDYDGDGRYLITDGETVTARPASVVDMQRAVADAVVAARRQTR
ncbi:hypothetical protein ABH922_003485 [Rhodococcus sp. 27YEA15]|uniref:ESX secretion-associated protein EspG n=1 Tax=Rhodococcus sp. 27YEA15 TaxID=3156259 RepID=UPI003C7D1A41